MLRISNTDLNFEREPLGAPWGFKGGFLTELWQTVVKLESNGEHRGIGLGTQSVLWCDPRVFVSHSEAGGNALMLQMTEYALGLVRGNTFNSPSDMLDAILPPTLEYGRAITGLSDLADVFALNALVAVDNAAWMLWAQENGVAEFDEIIPANARDALGFKHSSVVSVPAVGYGLPESEIVKLIEAGFFVLKIKLGSDPDKDGDQVKMLRWDVERMRSIHAAVSELNAPGSPEGRALYYLDANGRYDSKERVWSFLDEIEKMGALHATVLLEEPFPGDVLESVGDLPIRIVADESASSVEETRHRIELGYGAIALKPIAKTLSMTFRIARLCHEMGVPAFCADLTVNPILVDWNKNIAARLPALPGMEGGLQETNGFQNYRDWDRMLQFHPLPDAEWLRPAKGRFQLDRAFYEQSGGVLTASAHYAALVGST
jgi:L-alanine-DL-glutamate epimerase-like enolase superfamily enzyme